MIDRLYVGGLDEVGIPQNEYYQWVANDLRPGVNEVLVHLDVETEELKSLIDGSPRRVEDFRIITGSDLKRALESKGVRLIGYRPIVPITLKRQEEEAGISIVRFKENQDVAEKSLITQIGH